MEKRELSTFEIHGNGKELLIQKCFVIMVLSKRNF